MGKAKKGYIGLYKFQQLMGGTINLSKKETEKQQEQSKWCVYGNAALDFCKVMKNYTFLKRPQLEEALAYKVYGRTVTLLQPVKSYNPFTGCSVVYPSVCFAARSTGTYSAHICKCLKGELHTAGKLMWTNIENPVKTDDINHEHAEIEQKLKTMKGIDHELIDPKLKISYAYFAGFVDADGCLAMNGLNSQKHSISQKYRAVCDAFKIRFGGTVTETTTKKNNKTFPLYVWYICKGAKLFLLQIHPFLIEKRKQAELILNITSETFLVDKASIRQLKGHQAHNSEHHTLIVASIACDGDNSVDSSG
jgi:hypothetical protein